MISVNNSHKKPVNESVDLNISEVKRAVLKTDVTSYQVKEATPLKHRNLTIKRLNKAYRKREVLQLDSGITLDETILKWVCSYCKRVDPKERKKVEAYIIQSPGTFRRFIQKYLEVLDNSDAIESRIFSTTSTPDQKTVQGGKAQ